MLCCLFGHKEKDLSNIEVGSFGTIRYTAKCSRCCVLLKKEKKLTGLERQVIWDQEDKIEHLNIKLKQLETNE